MTRGAVVVREGFVRLNEIILYYLTRGRSEGDGGGGEKTRQRGRDEVVRAE